MRTNSRAMNSPIATSAESPAIATMRPLVKAVREGGDPLALEQALISLCAGVEVAAQSCLRDALRHPDRAASLMANARTLQGALDAIGAMDRALEAADPDALGRAFAVLEQSSRRLDAGSLPSETTPPNPTLVRLTSRYLTRAEQAIQGLPDAAAHMAALAEVVAQSDASRAHDLCRKALALAADRPEIRARVRRLLGSIAPGYHLSMMNDVRRNETWDRVLRRAIRPGMTALEIGTGAGMLTLMAARAGATVTTCEFHPQVARIAREVIAANGFADRVQVLTKPSQELQVGVDLAQPADILFCDNFSDNMFSFEPLNSIADARARLLKPGAVCVPGGASVRVALARWDAYDRFFRAESTIGFDIRAASDFRSESVDLEIGDPGIELVSDDHTVFGFDFSQSTFPSDERVTFELTAGSDGVVHGIAQWIHLQLDADTSLDAKPAPGTRFFSNPRFYPFDAPVQVQAGQKLRIGAAHDSRTLTIWAA